MKRPNKRTQLAAPNFFRRTASARQLAAEATTATLVDARRSVRMTLDTRVARTGWFCWDTLRLAAFLRSCSPSVVTAYASSALEQRLVANARPMKKPRSKRASGVDPDDILPEYDFSKGRRNQYAARMASGHIVVLEPDVAKVFPNASAVNEALKALAGIIRDHRAPPRTRTSRRKSRKGSA